MQLEAKEKELFDLLMVIPPDLEAIEAFLRAESLTPSEVTRAAMEYVDECSWDADEYSWECTTPLTPQIYPNLHSTYLYDIVKLLLQFGLEPNGVYDDNNIMWILKYVNNEFIAVDTLALLLEHGGDPQLSFDSCMSIFVEYDFDVFFDAVEHENRHAFAIIVYCWMVLIGYGARYSEDIIQVFKEYTDADFSAKPFDLQKLRNFRNYYFGITHTERKFAISIYDKATLWEVVRIE